MDMDLVALNYLQFGLFSRFFFYLFGLFCFSFALVNIFSHLEQWVKIDYKLLQITVMSCFFCVDPAKNSLHIVKTPVVPF